MHSALTSTVNGGPGYNGTAGALKVLNRKDIGGKTGTTNNSRAAWFAGFYGQTVTAVYTAKDSNKTLGAGETGGRSGLPAWLNYYQNLRKVGIDYPVYEPRVPSNIVSTLVNSKTGMLDSSGYKEYFISGTDPQFISPSWDQNLNLNDELFIEQGDTPVNSNKSTPQSGDVFDGVKPAPTQTKKPANLF